MGYFQWNGTKKLGRCSLYFFTGLVLNTHQVKDQYITDFMDWLSFYGCVEQSDLSIPS